MRAPRRRGFALLMVLWVMTVASIAGLSAVLSGRDSYNVARNRFEAERAYWRAVGCLNVVRTSIDQVLENASSPTVRARRWRALDTLVSSVNTDSMICRVSLAAAGDRLDINSASEESLRRILDAVVGSTRAAALTDVLLDWRDADGDARPLGAEAEWYAAAHRRVPRDGPIASIEELRRVRGFEDLAGLDTLLGVEPGRVSVATAPLSVLAAVPGVIDGTLTRLAELRADGQQVDDMISLIAMLPRPASDSLMIHFSDAAQMTTLEPDAWIATVTATSGSPAISAMVEVRIVRRGSRSALVRYRSRS